MAVIPEGNEFAEFNDTCHQAWKAALSQLKNSGEMSDPAIMTSEYMSLQVGVSLAMLKALRRMEDLMERLYDEHRSRRPEGIVDLV